MIVCSRKISEDESVKLENLYNTYRTSMYFVAYRILHDEQLAEDAVHHAFVKIVDSLDKLDELNFPKTKRFLIIVVRNIAYDMYNKRAKFPNAELFDETDLNVVDESPSPIETVLKKERNRIIDRAVMSLPDIYKDILLLEKSYNCTLKDISKLTNIKYDTVKKRKERAIKMLADMLRKEDII